MEKILKKHFTNFTINNASKRNNDQLLKITLCCQKIDTLLVVIFRNKINDQYFQINEMIYNAKNINIIILNKDNLYYFCCEHQNINIIVMTLKRKILEKSDCIICMDECKDYCNENYYSCIICGNFMHKKCLDKCKYKDNCPICKNRAFNMF